MTILIKISTLFNHYRLFNPASRAHSAPSRPVSRSLDELRVQYGQPFQIPRQTEQRPFVADVDQATQHELNAPQVALPGISRGSVCSLPKPGSDADLALMRRIDELHLEHPFMGVRMLRRQLRQEGVKVGRATSAEQAYLDWLPRLAEAA